MVSDGDSCLLIFNRDGNARAMENHGASRNVINPYCRRGNNQTFSSGVKPIAVRNPYKKSTTIDRFSASLQDNIFDKKVVSASIFCYLTRDQDDGRETIFDTIVPPCFPYFRIREQIMFVT